ncbi:MAG: RIP metalloprotease RseP [Lachnospiraceae bacterium]|nr:RIP metalloprotease RseP [Lachnospiraceae bacterium]
MKIFLFLIIFTVIILVHEMGHFLLGKKNGIGVVEFSLGLGPTICGFTRNGTKYSLKLLPFGGACMFEGEDGISDSSTAFPNVSVWGRIATVAAGPIFNFILAFFLSLFVIGSMGYDAPIIADVMEGYPASQAGIQAGDQIVKLDHSKINVYREISMYTQFHEGNSVEVTYKRDGKNYQTTLTPQYNKEEGRYLFGFNGSIGRVKGNPLQVIQYSAYEVKYWITITFKSLGMLVSGKVSRDDISGPVGVAKVVGDVYDASKTDGAYYVWLNMMNIAILLTANLGVMNLLPLPALDGGRLVFLIIEAIRRKRVDPQKEGMVHFVGLMALMALMVFIMFNDISKFFR